MATKKLRAAIYTRKSSEEGLEQDFNSLDAQRAAGEAYIKSQTHEGWKLVREYFDDGGFSGGTLDRPALQRLIAKVEAGEIDVIVVYKIDRLSRSLMDFAKLAETFDACGVSFVSVTQAFRTHDSMGRLMLNVLLSFAQFEREVTGERIRDKIKASKQKGMWMGGTVPMGYVAQDCQLVPDAVEAKKVRSIFELYIADGSVAALADRLVEEGIRTTRRTTAKGKTIGGLSFTRGHLYRMLSNPVYIGRIPHKDTSYPGTHDPIIDRALWDDVQALLESNAQGGRTKRHRAEHPSLLAGILCTADGTRLIATHAQKGQRRYRYYQQPDAGVEERTLRLPARELETAVLSAVRGLLADPSRLLPELGELEPSDITRTIARAGALAEALKTPTDPSVLPLFGSLITKVIYHPKRLEVRIDTNRLRDHLTLMADADADTSAIVLAAPIAIRKRGVQTKLVFSDGTPTDRPLDEPLLTALARGHDWANRLITGDARSIAEIAKAENMTASYVSHLVRLGFLAPDLVGAALEGRQPPEMTADALTHDAGLPIRWGEQVEVYRA